MVMTYAVHLAVSLTVKHVIATQWFDATSLFLYPVMIDVLSLAKCTLWHMCSCTLASQPEVMLMKMHDHGHCQVDESPLMYYARLFSYKKRKLHQADNLKPLEEI